MPDQKYPDFFVSNRMEKPHRGDAQWKVWKEVKPALSVGWSAGYYNYPISDARQRFEHPPDIFVLHADFGIVVITCRDYTVEDIDSVTNKKWTIRNERKFPVSEVQNQLAQIFSQIAGTPETMDVADKLSKTEFLALPNITAEEWEEAGFPDLNTYILFKSDIREKALRDRLQAETETAELSEEEFARLRQRINQGDILSTDRDPISEDEQLDSKKSLYRAATWGFNVHEQDRRQERIGLHIPSGPQQIRGIAGSGKSTIMAKKAAVMHSQKPDWDIVLTFNTRSLYQTIRSSVNKFYSDLSNEEELGDQLRIWHAWGQKEANTEPNEQHHGLYREIALNSGITPYRIMNDSQGEPNLEDLCEDLLEDDKEIPELYDAILIDEAQDFKSNFYKMCYEALREPKRLIWAYDEAQSLDELTPPTPDIIFGDEFAEEKGIDMRGKYDGGITKSYLMKQSYRTPREVLVAGHALGMGLYRDDGIINTLTTKEDWKAIGYENHENNDFSDTGSEIRLTRNKDLSPHPLQSNVEPGELIESTFCEDYETEVTAVARAILHDIEEEQLDPEQILVVVVGPWDMSGRASNETARNVRADRIESKLNELGQEEMGREESNPLAHRPGDGNRDEFWEDGSVTISGINRAKGNEAASVYIMGAEQISKKNWERVLIEDNDLDWRGNYVQVRNEIFVGITRSEGWCQIFGVGDTDNSFLNEVDTVIDEVSEPEPKLVFPAPEPMDMDGKLPLDESISRMDYFQTN